VKPLPTVPPSCSLNGLDLRDQVARYRIVGDDAEVVEWSARRRTIRVARSVPESVIERAVEIERTCCPCFELSWDRASRCLEISVTSTDQEPALDAIAYALGLTEPVSVSALSDRPPPG